MKAGGTLSLRCVRDRRQASCLFCILCRFPGGTSGKDPTCQCRRHKRRGFNPWVREMAWRKAWQPTWYSCLENTWTEEAVGLQSMGLQSRAWLKKFSTTQHIGFKNWTFIVNETPFKEGGSVYMDTFSHLIKDHWNMLGPSVYIWSIVLVQFSCSVVSNSLSPHGL